MNNIENTSVMVCGDCRMPIGYGDFTALDFHYSTEQAEERMQEIEAGMDELATDIGFLSLGEDYDDFSAQSCACCGTTEAGDRFEVVGTKTTDQAA